MRNTKRDAMYGVRHGVRHGVMRGVRHGVMHDPRATMHAPLVVSFTLPLTFILPSETMTSDPEVAIPATDYTYPHLKSLIEQTTLRNSRAFEFIQGYFFGILNAPRTISTDEWLPFLFGDSLALIYEHLNSSDRQVGDSPSDDLSIDDDNGWEAADDLSALFRAFLPAAASGRWRLPRNVYFLPNTIDNLNADAPIARWSCGFNHALALWPADARPRRIGRPTGAPTDAVCFFGDPDEQVRNSLPAKRGTLKLRLAEYYRACVLDAMEEIAESGNLRKESRKSMVLSRVEG